VKKLDAYRGKLSPGEIAEGMNAARENASRLAEDAKLLLEQSRYPSAVSLAILSIEEAGKVTVLRELSIARTEKERLASWRAYRSHTKKNTAWILPQLVASGARTLDELQPIFEESSDHPYVLDQLKQIGIYTDCLGKRHWSIPEEVIDEELARIIVGTAKLLSSDRRFSAREVELWIEHIGPVWKGDCNWMKQALVNWASAMHEEGLGDPPARMEHFVRGNESEGKG
jgi:AbiV family abortive infection protein